MSSQLLLRSGGVFLFFLFNLAIAWNARAVQVAVECGDVDASGVIGATDALLLLKKAVGQSLEVSCPPCSASPAAVAGVVTETCGDLDGSGIIGATDALLLLKKAVGQAVTLACPTCSSTTTTTLAVPEGCGNGVVGGTEECERLDGCAPGERCTALCTCEAIPTDPPTSQQLIAEALEGGEIDYPTSLLYRVWALFDAPELPEQFDGAGSFGEDTDLLIELSQVRDTLPAEIESAIAPYLVRPTDPTSIYSQPPAPAFVSGASASLAAPPPVGCLNVYGFPNWGYFETEHFVIWSCNSGRCDAGKPSGTACELNTDCDTALNALDGVCTAATDAARRPVAGALAEGAYAKLTTKLGPPRDDDNTDGPEPRSRIDVYLLRPNECRMRGGLCLPIEGNAIAQAFFTTPCSRSGGSATRSSGYAMMNAKQVPVNVPGSDEPSEFRGTFVHELFHVWQFGLNLDVAGVACGGTFPEAGERTWLLEASAEWAGSFGFYGGVDGRNRRTVFFQGFQRRYPQYHGLQDTRDTLAYQAALYLQFLQQEAGSIQPVIDLWTTSQAARTARDFDRHLDSIAPLSEHFRDFAVRDLNKQLPGNPISPLFADLDPSRPANVLPSVPLPHLQLVANMDLSPSIQIAPLFMQSELYSVADDARFVKVDVSSALNAAHVQIDAIVKVGSEWKRRKVPGPVFQFCREDEDDDISEFYLVFSNRDLAPYQEGKVDGTYKIQTKSFCPGGWSGEIRVEQKLDEYSLETVGDTTTEVTREERELHRWTVTGTTYVTPEGYPFEVEQLDTTWHGTRSVLNVTEYSGPDCSTSISTESGDGSGSDDTPFQVFPAYAGSYTLTPAGVGHEFETPIKYVDSGCDGTSTADGTQMIPEALSYLAIVPELSLLTPAPNDPGHFTGSATVLHDEQPRPGGQQILDVTVTWDLKRTEQR